MLTNQQFVDHERQYLAAELKRTTDSNYKMAYLHDRVAREKGSLQEKIEELTDCIAEKNFEIEQQRVEIRDLQNMLCSKLNDNNELQKHFLKTQLLLQENTEKSQMVIHYQHQIITLKDERDLLNKDITVLKVKNNNLLQKMNDLRTDYDWQRSCSLRLSEQVDQNNDEIKELRKTRGISKKIFDLQFDLARVTEERDDALQKMKEFRDVTTGLKVKYDMLQQEKHEEIEKMGQLTLLS